MSVTSRAQRRARLFGMLAALCLGFGGAKQAPAQLPPAARWFTFDTPRFRVHYTAGLEPVARRAAERAETAYVEVSAALVEPPPGRIDLVVADNVDFANGYATPLPSNRIVVYAHPPVDTPSLSFYDDWLELVITHELVHIFHLDYARGVWRPLRGIFGRSPLLFPQIWAPGWLTEGLATHLESRLTESGRVRGTMHDMALRTAILEDRFFSLSRASNVSVTWPAGNTRYVYGSLFVDYLAERYGADRVGRFIESVGSRLVPGELNTPAKQVFGVSFREGWREWEAALQARYAVQADSLRALGITEPEVLTEAGRYALFPRFAPSGAAIAYAASTGREEASTRLLLPDGSERTLARRNSLGPASWLPGGDALILSQLEFQDPYHLYADVFRVETDGVERRLTDGARLMEPHVAPDGRRVVGIRSAGGTNVPVVLDLATGAMTNLAEPALSTHWSLPRWSPDGSRIAAARWRAGGFFDVVVMDSAGGAVRELTRDRAVDNAPAWAPDGRYVVFSSDRTGIANLYAYDLRDDRLWQVTNVLSGAFQPDVSPDGLAIAFSLYAADGYHIARIPWDPAAWRPAPPVRAAVAVGSADTARFAAIAGGPARRYSPWPSLAPTSWTPLLATDAALGVAAGAAVFGTDLIGRHAYSAYAQVFTEGAEVTGSIAYRYAGLGIPLVDASVSQGWTASTINLTSQDGAQTEETLLRRDQTLALGVTFPRRRIRTYQWVSVGGEVRDRSYRLQGANDALPPRYADFPTDVAAILSAGHSSVRRYEYSISPEDGFAVSGTVQGRRYTRAFAGDENPAGYVRLTSRARTFRGFDVAGFARHVLAGRLSAGADLGSRSPLFDVGGASDGPGALNLGADLEIGSLLAYPVRGFPEGTQLGDRAVSASAEYRFPLALLEGNIPLLPGGIDRLWGAVFADAGAAWCADGCDQRLQAPDRPDPLVSTGAELGVDFGGVALRGGVAVPMRGTGPTDAGDAKLYLRLGSSF